VAISKKRDSKKRTFDEFNQKDEKVEAKVEDSNKKRKIVTETIIEKREVPAFLKQNSSKSNKLSDKKKSPEKQQTLVDLPKFSMGVVKSKKKSEVD
jgi:hypothetical protein